VCDYSLLETQKRAARVGDKLTTRVFDSGTRGTLSKRVMLLSGYSVGTEVSFADDVGDNRTHRRRTRSTTGQRFSEKSIRSSHRAPRRAGVSKRRNRSSLHTRGREFYGRGREFYSPRPWLTTLRRCRTQPARVAFATFHCDMVASIGFRPLTLLEHSFEGRLDL
jgi:hypothetical protein